jgi:hypothetical protein
MTWHRGACQSKPRIVPSISADKIVILADQCGHVGVECRTKSAFGLQVQVPVV